MKLVGAEQAWAVGTGAGITIAVVDTGMFFGHEDFASGKVLHGHNFIEDGQRPDDDVGHGTHVAGIAAASAGNGRGVVGVAPGAKILPVRVLENDDDHPTHTVFGIRSGVGTVEDVNAGIRWAVDNGAHVVNLSLGNNVQGVVGSSFVDAVRYAWERGVICVFAAGNAFVTGSGFKNEPALVVSATNRHDNKPLYSSGVGEAQWGIAAPGGEGGNTAADDILSTYWEPKNDPNTYAYAAGTSMAAPFVAGAAAILRGLGLTPQQTVDRLLATAKDIGDPGRDHVFGTGRLDLAKAVAGPSPAVSPSGGAGTKGTRTAPAGGTASSTTSKGDNSTTRAGSVGSTASGSTGGAEPADGLQIVAGPARAGSVRPEDRVTAGREAPDPDGSGEPAWPWAPSVAAVVLLGLVARGIVRGRRT